MVPGGGTATLPHLPENHADSCSTLQARKRLSTRSGDWIYEIGFDGYRALALRGGSETRVLSRNQKDLGKKFTNKRNSIAALDVQDAIIAVMPR